MHMPLELADIAADVLARICDRSPRVHCSDSVAQQYTANMLLAAARCHR
jgi:hydroxyethylthiazole kinase-like sugar kinase family protein